MADERSTRKPTPRNSRSNFYKYVSPDGLIAILESLCLKWSSPLLFNDPFDTPRILKLPFEPEELNRQLRSEVASAIRDGVGNTSERLRRAIEALRSSASPAVVEAVARHVGSIVNSSPGINSDSFIPLQLAWTALVMETRVLCLTETRDSLPMWAHYANNHAGAVLEFVCRDELDSVYRLAQPIKYLSRMPSLPNANEWARQLVSGVPLDIDGFFREYLLGKTVDWGYEKEWRIIGSKRHVEDGLESYWGFEERELRSVTLGAACSSYTTGAAKTLLREPEVAHVLLEHATIDHHNQQLTFTRLSTR